MVFDSDPPEIYAKNILLTSPATNCTAAYQQALHAIIKFYIQKLGDPVTESETLGNGGEGGVKDRGNGAGVGYAV